MFIFEIILRKQQSVGKIGITLFSFLRAFVNCYKNTRKHEVFLIILLHTIYYLFPWPNIMIVELVRETFVLKIHIVIQIYFRYKQIIRCLKFPNIRLQMSLVT